MTLSILLYIACGLGALGVIVAMPRAKAAPFVIGAIIGAVALGVALIALGRFALRENGGAGGGVPNAYFYIFSAIALGSALRVITHQRPIYSALYFILTILASTGLYLLLQAEFMAFALVIVYAGAILITYMFVIMLATEGPTAEAVEVASTYDRVAREPVAATFAGFVLVAVLTTMMVGGVKSVTPAHPATGQQVALMSTRVEKSLRAAGIMKEGEKLAPAVSADIAAFRSELGQIKVLDEKGVERLIPRNEWPSDLTLTNPEALGWELINSNPGAIEMAGVILLMAMLGAVVLARKKVEMDEQAKADAARKARDDDDLGRDGPFYQPSVGGNR